ncbi:MAG: polysaccharide biosynthesis protein [Alicyclobacillus macrosporangiidus]|uniref:putative polysaccharide biosynthesis protein n=1 Tax=Alicyclobacillus macrosporangiidus TaxID=392015 RepID=UPI0026EBEB28|nr:polysaccharide biosynthesis protein [Alicyclobacillus macrosporangiidus]MCL6600830.1 polysaccharide biosynthesis protein [Alicyclobacillus macrosporangiidus]
MQVRKSSSLTRGASVMVASVTAAKLLGLIYLFPLTRLIHDEGIGIYSNAYALYVILLTLATAGFPTAMGKLVSERLALRRYGEVEGLYRITVRTVVRLGVILAILMWFGAPLYARMVALRESAQAVSALTLSIRALAPALLVVPLMSALRGYLQGFQRLEPSAYSQALEQLVRVVAIVIGAWWVMRGGGTPALGAAAATFGAFVGALAGLVLLLVAVHAVRREFRSRWRRPSSRTSTSALRRELWQVALPISLGTLVVPISGLVDSLTVQNTLLFAGYSFQHATEAYGVLSRQAMQLIQLPLAFAMAVGASVLPAIAQARTLRDQAAIENRVNGTVRSMLFMTFPVAAALLILGRPIDQMLYGSTEGALIISSVSFMSVFSSLELISTYMLQGLNEMYRPVRNMFLGVLVKLVLNIALIFPFHILGAAMATTIGYLFSSALNVLAVKKYGHVHFSVIRLALPSAAAAALTCPALAAGSWLGWHAMALVTRVPDLLATAQVVFAIAIGGAVYVTAAIALGAVQADELQRLPAVGRQLARVARRLRPSSAQS